MSEDFDAEIRVMRIGVDGEELSISKNNRVVFHSTKKIYDNISEFAKARILDDLVEKRH